jgi:hypothetical protein
MATKELTQVFDEFDGENTDYRRRRSDSGLHRLAAVTTGTPLEESELIDGEVIIDLLSPKSAHPIHTPMSPSAIVQPETEERAAARDSDRFDERDSAPVAAEPEVQPRPSASRAAEVVRQIQARAAQPGAVEAATAAAVSARRGVNVPGQVEAILPERTQAPLAASGPADAGGRTERYRAVDTDEPLPNETGGHEAAPKANRRRERDAAQQRTPVATKSNVSVMRRVADPAPAADLELPTWPDNFDDLPGIERNTPIAGHVAVDDGADFEFVAESVAKGLDAAFGEIASSVAPGPIDQRADTRRNDKTPTERIETAPPRANSRRAQTLRMHSAADGVRPSLRPDTDTVEAQAVSGDFAQAYEDELGDLERIDEVGSMVDPVFADLAEPEPAVVIGRAETPIRGLRAVVDAVEDSSVDPSEVLRVDERSYERHSAIEVDEVSAPRRRKQVTSQLDAARPSVSTQSLETVSDHEHGVSPMATLLALVIGPAVAAVVSFSLAAIPVLAWLGGTVGLFVSLFAAGLAIRGRWDGAFINDCGHISASRLQLVVWTAILFPPLLVAVSWNAVVATNAAALEIAVPPTLWGLFAMAVASTVAAPMIRGDMQRRGVPLHRTNDNRAARWSDVFRRELSSVRDVVSVGKLQLLYVTGVLAAAYVTALYPTMAALEASNRPLEAFPAPSIGVLVLLILSHAAYLGDKVTDDASTRVDAATTTIG